MRINSRSGGFLPAAILSAALTMPLAAQNYTFSSPDCGNVSLNPTGMNGAGVVVGSPFIYYNGKCTVYSKIDFNGISDTGWLFIYPMIPGNKTFYLLPTAGKPTPLPPYPDGSEYVYCCIDSAAGVLAGNYWPTFGATEVGFFYQNGKFTSLPWSDAGAGKSYWYTIAAMNNTGITVGNYEGPYSSQTNSVGFVYAKGKMTLLQYPGAQYTFFGGVNDYGIVAGSYILPDNHYNIFTYNLATGVWKDLNFPYPYSSMTVFGISNAGLVALTVQLNGVVIATPNPPASKP